MLHLWALVGWWLSPVTSTLLVLVRRLSFKKFLLLIAIHYAVFICSVVLVMIEHQLLHTALYGQSNTVIASTNQSREVGRDQTIEVDLLANDYDQSVNLIQLDLKYDPKNIELTRIDYTRSFASIFIQEIIDNKLGFARVVVATPNPGMQQPEALIGTAIFRAQQTGLTSILILPSSKVLANDGKATNLFKKQQGIALFIGELTRDKNLTSQSSERSPSTESKISLLMDEEILPNPMIFSRSRNAGGIRDTVLTKIELFDSIVVGRYMQLFK